MVYCHVSFRGFAWTHSSGNRMSREGMGLAVYESIASF